MSKWAKIMLVGLILGYTVTMSYLSIRRHNAFASGYDLANMDQTVWETSRGNIFQLSGANGLVSRFNYHADIILVLIAPVYWVWNDVAALLTVQSLFLGLAALPIFLIAKKIWKNETQALLLAMVYLVNPGVMWINMYDFHGVSMAIFFTLMTVYFGLEKKWLWMYNMAVLAMMTKENVPLAMVMVGVGLMMYMREYKRGLVLIVMAVVWFVLTVFVVMPLSNEGKPHWVWEWYQKPTLSQDGELKKYADLFTNSDSIEYYDRLLRPWGYLPLLGLPWLVLSAPELAINSLSSQGQMKSIVMHYDSMIIPGLVLGVIFGLAFLKSRLKDEKWGSKLLFAPILFMLAFAAKENYFYSPLPTTRGHWKLMYNVGEDETRYANLLKTIPADASITASSPVRPHLTHRVHATNLPHGLETSDYVAIVEQNRLVGDHNTNDHDYNLARRLAIDEMYETVDNIGPFWLFKKK